MGFFDDLFGPTPSQEHLGWVEQFVPGSRVFSEGGEYPEIRLGTAFHDSQVSGSQNGR
jgi:hypothetical protein